jgi:hypothetical protein
MSGDVGRRQTSKRYKRGWSTSGERRAFVRKLRTNLKAELNQNQDPADRYEIRRRHTITRIRQRYGLAITEEDYDFLLKRVVNGSGEIMLKEKNGFRLIAIMFQATDTELTVVYDPGEKVIRTVLPPYNEVYRRFINNKRRRLKWE